MKPELDDWETRVQKTAQTFAYPPNPRSSRRAFRHRQRRAARQILLRIAQVAAILLLILLGLLAVPQIRAQVLAFFRIGAVEVIVTTATPPARFSGGDLPASVLDFPGVTTLEDARAARGLRAPFARRAPRAGSRLAGAGGSPDCHAGRGWMPAACSIVSLQLLPPEPMSSR